MLLNTNKLSATPRCNDKSIGKHNIIGGGGGDHSHFVNNPSKCFKSLFNPSKIKMFKYKVIFQVADVINAIGRLRSKAEVLLAFQLNTSRALLLLHCLSLRKCLISL